MPFETAKLREKLLKMIKIDRTPLPAEMCIKDETHYRSGSIFDLIVKDCHNKCYICEDKELTAINVEHRVAHKGDKVLKYDWENLFLSCAHCNSTKNFCIDAADAVIIDPVKFDPEEYIEIALAVTDELKEEIVVKKIKDGESIDATVMLLDHVYNGVSTDIKRLESANLKNKIMDEIKFFRQYVSGYKEEPDLGYHDMITEEISRKSAFAAIKRNIIRKDPEIAEKFSEALFNGKGDENRIE